MEITECLDQVLEGEGDLELDLVVGQGQTVDNPLISKDPKGVYQVPIAKQEQVQGLGAHPEPEGVRMLDNHLMGKLLEGAPQEDQQVVQGVLHQALEVHLLVADLGQIEVEQMDLKVEDPGPEGEHLDPEVEYLVVKEGEILILRLDMAPQAVPKMDP